MALIWPIPGTKADWKLRSDVLFHFFAYQHFSHMYDKDVGIDLVNLSDGDVQFYNRTYDNIKGLQTYGKLAMYLNDFITTHPFPATITSNTSTNYRAHLIAHIRSYNSTTTPRRRFYMLNLSFSELDSLASTTTTVPTNIATDGVTASFVGGLGDKEAERDEKFVAEKVLQLVMDFEAEFDGDEYVGCVESEDEGEDEGEDMVEGMQKLGLAEGVEAESVA